MTTTTTTAITTTAMTSAHLTSAPVTSSSVTLSSVISRTSNCCARSRRGGREVEAGLATAFMVVILTTVIACAGLALDGARLMGTDRKSVV